MGITPKQAYEAAKTLWPGAKFVRRSGDATGFIYESETSYIGAAITVDWPEGMKQYPPPPPQWVDPVWPDDWGKEAQFSDNGSLWVCGRLAGRSSLPKTYKWLSDDDRYKFCQVKKEQS